MTENLRYTGPDWGADLILCADATPTVGAGHVMRLLSLAEAWLSLGIGEVSLYGDIGLGFVHRRAAALGVGQCEELPRSGASVIVVDSYDSRRRVRLGSAGGKGDLHVLVDDLGEKVPRGYEVVWNPNAYGSADMYPRFTGEVVSGPDAVPVRGGLPRWSGSGAASTGFMLGGAVPPSHLLKAIVMVAERLGEANVTGAGAWVPKNWSKVDSAEPWNGLSRCARLVTAAGTSVWEAAAVRIPAVVVRTAANQDLVFAWAARAGVPVIDAQEVDDPAELAESLSAALDQAIPLPSLRSGAEAVARRLNSALLRGRS